MSARFEDQSYETNREFQASPMIPTAAESGSKRRMPDPSPARDLPILVTANDIREMVQYLKQRPDGINICDVIQPIKKRIFFPPKVEAYLLWGLIVKKGDRVTLSNRGLRFAKTLLPEARSYRTLLHETSHYCAALQWIEGEGLEIVTKDDMLEFWSSGPSEVSEIIEATRIQQGVVTFFHICQAAELGTFTIGKRGQPARLRVWRSALSDWVNETRLISCNKQSSDQQTIHLVITAAGGLDVIEEIELLLERIGARSEVVSTHHGLSPSEEQS